MVKEKTFGKKIKVSAFAVSQARQGKHKLDDGVTMELTKKVERIHEDKKLNKKAAEVATNYERNAVTNLKKKAKRRKDRRELLRAGRDPKTPKSKEVEEPPAPEKPLSWHNAPKSGKRIKLVESAEAEMLPIRGKGRRVKGPLGGVTPTPSETEDYTSADPELSLHNKMNGSTSLHTKKNGSTAKPQKVKKQKKPMVSVGDWNPPRLPDSEESSSGEQSSELDYSDSDSASTDRVCHSIPEKQSQELFAHLLHPHDPRTFFKNTWLKKPLHIRRRNEDYYKKGDWFSTKELNRILTQEKVRFGVNIDITTYKNGKRETHNPAGRAYPSIVWDQYQQGCSVRLLNPQTYCDNTWYLLSSLQQLFGCMVGANVYLTPPGTQGFAPHYDDIEAFVLQLEGQKHWKVYGPRTKADIWPLASSPNLTQEELGKPIIDCVLKPGDLLYFPRGSIHQAMTQDDQHSLHITVSTHQKNSWSDLLNLMIPAALENATLEDPEFRESLPNDYLEYTGIAFQERESTSRQSFLNKLHRLVGKLAQYSPVDAACDQMAKKFIHDSLPPYLSPTELICSVAEQGEKWFRGRVRDVVELQPHTKIRLIRKHSLRIVSDEDREQPSSKLQSARDGEGNSQEDMVNGLNENPGVRVYYNTDNDRIYHGNEIQYLDIDADLAPAVEHLLCSYPDFISVENLPLENITEKLDIAVQLYDCGLLLTKRLLEQVDESDSSDEEMIDETY